MRDTTPKRIGKYNMNQEDIKIGQIVRYDQGRTALIRVEEFHDERCYGQHAIGGGDNCSIHNVIRVHHPDDVEIWHETRRKFTQPKTRPTFESFQARTIDWLVECFGVEVAKDIKERCDRFLEEALELVQSLGYDKQSAHELVDYVFGRHIGEPEQEVGGVNVTLAALCGATGISMRAAAEKELHRICQPIIMDKIREKQKTKPNVGPLPGVYVERDQYQNGDEDE